MSVTRSAFASSAARSHCSRGRRRSCGPMLRARRAARSTRVAPACRACCDKRRLRASRRARASGVLRSWSKKNCASASRARSTRSLPWTIADGSRVSQIADDAGSACSSLPSRVGQREVLLVLLHGQDQAFLRHGEERGVERAGVHHRPFDQRRHLVEQRVGHDHRGAPATRSQLRATICRAAAREARGMTLPSASSVGAYASARCDLDVARDRGSGGPP